jgi:uncharacterized protein DUF3810
MEDVRIPNQATYSPIALTDLFLIAPLASRLLLGATVPGRVLQAVALGAYAGSALSDWWSRQDARQIDFGEVFGEDLRNLTAMDDVAREGDITSLAAELSSIHSPITMTREEVAEEVNELLTEYIASVTGQRVETSSEFRTFSISKLVFPFALGACDILSGDVTLFREAGIFEPHIICHEFCHRKGYIKELEAQALAYLSLMRSDNDQLKQSAVAERLHRNLRVLADGDLSRYHEMVDELEMEESLAKEFHEIRPEPSAYEKGVWAVMKPIYEERMKMTGQNGLSDYDKGFTDFIFSQER